MTSNNMRQMIETFAQSNTAGAAKGGITSLEGLTRYDYVPGEAGRMIIGQDDNGPYVLLDDVCSLLATTAGEQAEKVSCDQCGGVGGVVMDGDCTDCNGKGYNWEPIEAAPASPEQVQATEKHLPGWERGIATVTLTGHQLRAALDFLNPDGDEDADQLDNDLTFGIVQHKDDDGTVSTGMCCWNDDTDGVMPLDGEYTSAPIAAAPAAEEVRDTMLLDALDAWVKQNREAGYYNFVFAFDTESTARDQIAADDEIRALMKRAASTEGGAA